MQKTNAEETQRKLESMAEAQLNSTLALEQYTKEQSLALLDIANQLKILTKHLNVHENPSRPGSPFFNGSGAPKKKISRKSLLNSSITNQRIVYCRFNWFALDSLDLVAHTFNCKLYFEATWEIDDDDDDDDENNENNNDDDNNNEDNNDDNNKSLKKDIEWSDYTGWDPKIVFQNVVGEEPTFTFQKFAHNIKATKDFGTSMGSYQAVLSGTFSTQFDLRPFPYDIQKLEVTIGTNRTTNEMLFQPNPYCTSVATNVRNFSLSGK